MFIKFKEIKNEVCNQEAKYLLYGISFRDFQKFLLSKQFRLVDKIHRNSLVSVEKCLHIWSLIFPDPVLKGVLIRLYCVFFVIVEKKR